MKLSDFRIGKDFVHEGKRHRCTDIGTRCVLSIEVVRGWMNGPPYAQHETYWDEYCLPHCTPWRPALPKNPATLARAGIDLDIDDRLAVPRRKRSSRPPVDSTSTRKNKPIRR